MNMNTCKTDIAMSRNTHTLEKNRFVHLVCLSLVQPLSERELCEAETSYERYVGSVQRLLVPGRFSPADTLHTLAVRRCGWCVSETQRQKFRRNSAAA